MTGHRPQPRAAAFAFFAAFACFVLPAAAARSAEGTDSAALGESLDAWARPLVDAGLLSGNLVVGERGRILLERSWGFADREARIANTPDVPANIASVTKPMTVLLALQLIKEQKLAPTDPVSKWIPGFPMGDSITVEHLLRHRAGIPHQLTSDDERTTPRTAADMVAIAKAMPLTHRPGERSVYSSGGFSVLARVLELAGGSSYGALLRERVFEPLGMAHSFHPDPDAPDLTVAASYFPVHRGVERAPANDYSYLVGAGSVFSTARDVHALLWANETEALGEGIALASRDGRTSWNGHTNGYRAFAEYDPGTGHAIVFVSNLHSGAADALRDAVRALLAGETPEAPPAPPARAATVPRPVLKSYEGLYAVTGDGVGLPVRATATGLDVNGWSLVATSDSSFFSLRDFATVKVVAGARGIERFDWMIGGQAWPCPRTGDLPKN